MPIELNFGSVTAPRFADDPLAYARWNLEKHPEMYREFRRTADGYRAVNPARRVGSDMIAHVVRYYSGAHADDDQFKVNDHLVALFARLYKRQRQDANMPTRVSVLDGLTDEEWQELLELCKEETT